MVNFSKYLYVVILIMDSPVCEFVGNRHGQKSVDQMVDFVQHFFKKWANPGLFLFIFVLFNNNFTEKL